MPRWGSLTARPSQNRSDHTALVRLWQILEQHERKTMFGTQAKIDDKQNMDDMRTGTVLLCSADNIHNITTVRQDR